MRFQENQTLEQRAGGGAGLEDRGQVWAWAGCEGHLPRMASDKLAVPRRGGSPFRVSWATWQMTWERTSPWASSTLAVLEML